MDLSNETEAFLRGMVPYISGAAEELARRGIQPFVWQVELAKKARKERQEWLERRDAP